MVQTIPARSMTLRDVVEQCNVQQNHEDTFFTEWQTNLPALTPLDQTLLDKIRAGFLNLLLYPSMLENGVKMTVLDPLLFVSDCYLVPLSVKSEVPVEWVVEDQGTVISGKMDTLILNQHVWVMVIEAKQAMFSVEAGLGQLLSYLLAHPDPTRPRFGLITTGGHFMFLKVVHGDRPQYATSNIFSTRNPGDLYAVFKILKRLIQLASPAQ